MTKTHSEKTSADKTSIGFDYQYYFFLFKLLSLKTGQTIGFEVKDDVHIEESDGKQIFIQLKHTTQKKAKNAPISLTLLDIDLWKTLANWAKVISDKQEGREEVPAQLDFLNSAEFILVTNKSDGNNNPFIKILNDYKMVENRYSDLKSKLSELKDSTKDTVIKTYIGDLLGLVDSVAKKFINNLRLELDKDDLISKCKLQIKEAKILENKIDDVFSSLDSAIKADNFLTVKSGKKIEISFDDFYRKYRKYYDKGRNEKLPIRTFDNPLPERLESQTFIQQLLDINDIGHDNHEDMALFTGYRLKMENNLNACQGRSKNVPAWRSKSVPARLKDIGYSVLLF